MAKGRAFWIPVEQEYTAGQLSKAEISRRFGVSRSSMDRHMEKWGFVYASQAKSVRAKVTAKLITNPESADKGAELHLSEGVEMAAERGANVIRSHRKDIRHLAEVEQQLLSELLDDPQKAHVFSYQGVISSENFSLVVTERLAGFRNLVQARDTRIKLERQAYNLDEERNDLGGTSFLDDLLGKCDTGGLPRK